MWERAGAGFSPGPEGGSSALVPPRAARVPAAGEERLPAGGGLLQLREALLAGIERDITSLKSNSKWFPACRQNSQKLGNSTAIHFGRKLTTP